MEVKNRHVTFCYNHSRYGAYKQAMEKLILKKVSQGQLMSFEVTQGQKTNYLRFENFQDTGSDFGTGSDIKSHGF